jgi:hypothetical protein
MPLTAVVCERDTGIVCHADGRRFCSGETRPDTEFSDSEAARAWCQELVTQNPNLECWVRDEAGEVVAVFR